MSIETEVKIRIADFQEFRCQVDTLGGAVISGRHFEDNYIFDFEDARIRKKTCLVRVRSAGEKCFLTFKGPPKREGLFKTRQELETEVGNATIAKEILQQLGMKVWFRYQKFREEFRVLSRGQTGEAVWLSLDETPIGNYAEFEGSEKGILELAGFMGIRESSFQRASYYSLYIEHCRELKKPALDMIFPGTGSQNIV